MGVGCSSSHTLATSETLDIEQILRTLFSGSVNISNLCNMCNYKCMNVYDMYRVSVSIHVDFRSVPATTLLKGI